MVNCAPGAIRVESGVGCATAMIQAALTGAKEATCGDPSPAAGGCCGGGPAPAAGGCGCGDSESAARGGGDDAAPVSGGCGGGTVKSGGCSCG
jgi:hypothetical protein